MRSFQVKRRAAYPSRYSKRSRLGGKSRGRYRSRRRSGGGVTASVTRDTSTRVFRSTGGRRRKAFARFKLRVNKVEQSSFPRSNIVMSSVNQVYTSVAGTQTIAPNAQVDGTTAVKSNLIVPTLFSGFALVPGTRDIKQVEAFTTGTTVSGAGSNSDPSFWIHSAHCEVQFANSSTIASCFLELWEFICIKDITYNGLGNTNAVTSATANNLNSYDSLGTLADAGFNGGDITSFTTGTQYSKVYGFDFLQNYKWMQYFKLVKKSRIYLPNVGDGMGDGNVTYEMGLKKSVKYTDEKFGGKLAVAGYTKVLGICVYGCPGTTGAPIQASVTANWVNHYVASGPNVGIIPLSDGPGIAPWGNRPFLVPS